MYGHTNPGDWIHLGLNGNDRWTKKVNIALSHQFQGYSVVDGNVLRNTDLIAGSIETRIYIVICQLAYLG